MKQLTRAKDIPYYKEQVNKEVSKEEINSIISKGLRKQFEHFSTLQNLEMRKA